MVTGLDNASAVDDAFESGATDFLAKPLNWTLMRQRVRFMLRHSATTQRLVRNEQVLEQAQSMVRMGHWEWDLRTGALDMSPRLLEMFPHLENLHVIHPGSNDSSFTEVSIVKAMRQSIARREPGFTREFSVGNQQDQRLQVLITTRIHYEGDTPVHMLASTQDITERYLNEERYTAIFNNSPVGILEADFTGLWELLSQARDACLPNPDALAQSLADVAPSLFSDTSKVRANSAAINMLGAASIEEYLNAFSTAAQPIALAMVEASRQGQKFASLQRTKLSADGTEHHLVIRIPLPCTRAESERVVLSITDVTELIDQQSRLRRADKIIENSRDGIAQMDKSFCFIAANPAYQKLIGYSIAELRDLRPTDVLEYLVDITGVKEPLEREGFWRGEIDIRGRNGYSTPTLTSISSVFDSRGELTGYVSVSTDIAPLKESEQRLSHLAHYDALTQLPNRLSLQEGLARELAATHPDTSRRALLYIDLDGFKLVNDSMGHATGDALLIQVAKRLEAISQTGDLLARIGGDEFALLMRSSPTREEAALQADQILTALREPFHLYGREFFIGASIGTCLYPDDATTAGDMLRNADSAMYEAKRLGRDQLCFYTTYLTDESSRRLAIENELRTGIQSGQLFLLYQPKYDASSGAMLGAEALVRWQSPTRGIVPPIDFIGIAEASGLIIALGEWVIHEACRQIAKWRDTYGVDIPVAINISALHLHQRSLLQVLADAISQHGINPTLLEIEITEDSLDFRDGDDTPYEILHSLSAMGLSIAIDDFGTGYSSLSQLKKMPISTLKIDRSFVNDIAINQSDYAIITAIVGLAKTLDMHIVAEGVENEEQAGKLRDLQCNVFQGFLYSKPIAAGDFVAKYLDQAPSTRGNEND